MRRAVAFVGPTLPRLHRKYRVCIEVKPPAAQGDIARVVARGVGTILLIDGVFGREPAVWHKELLWALAEGVRVLGASSMGALRAAELHRFGMEGVGSVFAAYRDGLLEADDEVALLHGPAEAEWLPMSEPLVNVRATLARAVRSGLLDEREARDATERMRARFYPDRTRSALRSDLAEVIGGSERAAAVAKWWRAHWVDAKRIDAARAWRMLTRADPLTAPPRRPSFAFSESEPWRRLRRQVDHSYQQAHSSMTDNPLAAIDPLPPLDGNTRRAWSLLALVSGDNNLCDQIAPDASELYSSAALDKIQLLAAVDSPVVEMRGDFRLIHRQDGRPAFEFRPEPTRNFGDPAELAKLLKDGLAGSATDRRALVIWGHGEGWRVSIDDGSRDALDISELRSAFDSAGLGRETMLDLLIFDACLMGTVENVADLAPYATHLLAASEVVPSTGLPYRSTIDILGSTICAGEAAGMIVDAFIDDSRRRGEDLARMAAVRLDRVAELLVVLDAVAIRLRELLPAQRTNIQAARLMARGCRAGDQVDTMDLVRQLARRTADPELAMSSEQLQEACDAAIIRAGQVSSQPGCGLNVWFPSQVGHYRRLAPMFESRAAARGAGGEWMRFLAAWHARAFAHDVV